MGLTPPYRKEVIEVNWPEVFWRTVRLACSSWSRTLRLCLVLLLLTETLAAVITIARLAGL